MLGQHRWNAFTFLFALQVSGMCCDALRKLFLQDKMGEASLAAVRVISGLVKSLNYNVRPEVMSQSQPNHHRAEESVKN